MIDSHFYRGLLIAVLAVLLSAAAAMSMPMSGCASSTNYMGIELRSGRADPSIQQLAIQARDGDQQALLHLAASYDYGVGVAADRDQAIRLYRLAARSDPGSIYVWVPNGNGGGRVQMVETGAARPGSQTARLRLQPLENERGVR